MAATFLAPAPKRTQQVDFSSPLLRFISNHYDVNSADYKDAISELNTLREATVVRTPDKHEAGLDLICRYYHQLVSLQARMPISEKEVSIKFSWYDAFSKEGFLSSGRKTSMISGVYEQCGVLFNIASLQAQIAKSQNFESDEGIKNACKHFQGASGTFQQLREVVYSELQSPPTPDLSAECSTALQSLMLAQAQEAFCKKVLKDKMKDVMIAKVAMQASDLFADAANNMQVGQVKSLWEKGWINIVVAKQHYYHGLAQYKMGCTARDEKLFGQAIARMQLSLSQLQDCDRHGEQLFNSRDLLPAVQRDFQAVKKDNDFIYNDRVPSPSSLDAIAKATIAKPLRLAGPASNFVDLFANLLPVEVSRAMSCYNDKRDQLVTMEIQKLKEGTQELQAVLNSLNLPACIEEGGGDEVPKSLVEKGDTLREKGGVETLQKMISELPELLQRNKEILNEVVRSLDEEEREDTSLKERFKDKWNRMPSGKLTEEIRAQVTKYQTHLQTAEQADVTVRSKYDQHISMMILLCKPATELSQQLPKPTKQAAIATGSKVVSDLRVLMDEVTTLNKQRDSLMTTLKEQSADDIVTKFLTALKDEGVLDEASLSDAHLSLVYDPLKERVEESLQSQQQLVAKIQSAHQVFVQECGQDSSGRDDMLRQLASSYDAFVELESNLTEGTKFYNNLTSLLVKLQSRVNDMLFARNTEKDGLLKDLQTNLAQVPPEQPVAPPRPTPLPRKQVSPQVARAQQPAPTPPVQQPVATPPVRQPVATPPVQQPVATPPVQQPVATPPVQQPVATSHPYHPQMPPAQGQPPPMYASAPPPPPGAVPYYPQYYAPPQPYAYQPLPQGYPVYTPPYQYPGAPPPRGAPPPPGGYYQPPPR